jgi:hypothetical protein
LTDPTKTGQERVVPIVQDNKNALLLRIPGTALSETPLATLQHALARGLEVVFQLEEGEISTEPVPARDQRRAILLYEATEGGAGVLGRLTSDVTAIARVARKALALMHFDNIDAAVAAADPGKLATQPETRCVAGCYRCLLSYYNQPDHELIDRMDAQVISVLLRLSRSTIIVEPRATPGDPAEARNPSEVDWRDAVARWGLPKPDPEPLRLDGGDTKEEEK